MLGQAVILGKGGADVHELEALVARAAMHVRMVELHEGAADVLVLHVDAGQHKAFAILSGQSRQVLDGGGVLAAGEVEAGKIDGAHISGASIILP